MKPHLLKLERKPQYSFSIRFDSVPYFYNRWHFHEELELVHIHNGMGTQFIGLTINRFKPGDMILVGSNLTHMWRCDDVYFSKDSNRIAEATVIHFHPKVFGDLFFALPEHKSIYSLFQRAKQGLKVEGPAKKYVEKKILNLYEAKGVERTVLLLQILNKISHSRNARLIASEESLFHNSEKKESEKLNAVYQYILCHFSDKVPLEKIAAVADMAPNSFCRYFKSHTRKTFSRYLAEVRIAHACKLLAEKDLSITEICYRSGFKNLSNFNRFFRRLTQTNPFQYKKEIQKV
jgi:AraC-like DNA-binding protein